jgi:hypothetical protein
MGFRNHHMSMSLPLIVTLVLALVCLLTVSVAEAKSVDNAQYTQSNLLETQTHKGKVTDIVDRLKKMSSSMLSGSSALKNSQKVLHHCNGFEWHDAQMAITKAMKVHDF